MTRLLICTLLVGGLVLTGLVPISAVRADDSVLPPTVRAHAIRRTTSVTIDGHLDEPAWAAAPRQTGFVQRFPKDGGKAEHQTSFAVLYDDEAMYVGVWAEDSEPEKIRRLLTRRDVDSPSDSIAIGFDSYHDRRTAFVFQLNAAGVQRDMLLFDDQAQDDTWDAVWTGNAAVTGEGWTSEFRIPLNQLRFSSGDTHEWGFQIVRMVARTQEQTAWSPWPRSAPQIVSKFGLVDGIDHLKPGRRVELLPYALGGVDVMPIADGDPLNAHASMRRNFGLDVKYGLGPAFTLSATINPDFGQVEADPSQVNLSANELFFAEKRPFFLEGVDLFKLPIGNSDNTVEGAFYSRRIGAAPPAPDGKYVKSPQSTDIYGAGKLTGKAQGWSIGVFDAVTGQESADVIDEAGTSTQPIVAPLTNYAVARVKRDLRDGKTSIGMSASAVNRSLSGSPLAATLHDQAYTAGAQLQHHWGNNAWEANLHMVSSWVHGTEDAIAVTQRSNRHLFQRPDRTDLAFDPHRTSLGGFGATWMAGQIGDTKHWRFGSGGDLRTPGLELNDLGFQTNSDRVIPFVWGQYRVDEPSEHLLNWQANADVFLVNTFEPRVEAYGLECNANIQLPNYWQFGAGCNLARNRWDTTALRGGPALRADAGTNGFAWFNTDTRKRVYFNFNLSGNHNWTTDNTGYNIDVAATIQARSNIDIAVGPSWAERDDPLQYVDQVDDGTMKHYILARIKEHVASVTVRMNWTFSPHLSLQAYAQPFVAAGRYSEYKDVNNPHAFRYEDRFHLLQGSDYAIAAGTVNVNYAGTYSFAQPDFNFRQLRSTLVMRWEYRPGSTVFAIWSHGRTDQVADGRFRLGHDFNTLIDGGGENIVMVKANYWIGL
ncbi:MAG: hypothetical protein JWO36_6585 [Myxococcales bacterium]|nr:hypothetical protein [Myxococcales bacterium]